MTSERKSTPVISLKSVTLNYVIHSAGQASLRGAVLSALVGGALGQDKGGHVNVKALRGVTIDVDEGDRVALYGHNGSGKTTALRVAAGVYEPNSGAVRVRGSISAMLDLNVGMSPDASGRSNIRLLGLHRGLKSARINAMMDDIEEFSQLGSFFDLPIRTYSAGMMARLGFAFATALDPDILILDEWITPGDAEFLKRASERMVSHADNARALLMASHSIPVIKDVCNKVYVLEKGLVIDKGPPDEVFARLESKEK
jgi:ABC-type polysaccharide/polyol phosphate transport system ATPase subunit